MLLELLLTACQKIIQVAHCHTKYMQRRLWVSVGAMFYPLLTYLIHICPLFLLFNFFKKNLDITHVLHGSFSIHVPCVDSQLLI